LASIITRFVVFLGFMISKIIFINLGLNFSMRFRGYTISMWISDVSKVNAYFPIIGILECNFISFNFNFIYFTAKLGITNDASVSLAVNKHPVSFMSPLNSMTTI
jgi:hypothetical protein